MLCMDVCEDMNVYYCKTGMFVHFFIVLTVQDIVSVNLSLADVDNAVSLLMNILYEAAMPRFG